MNKWLNDAVFYEIYPQSFCDSNGDGIGDIACCLSKGMIYNDILNDTGASSATISRVNRSLQYGSGGYDLVFERLGIGEKKP